MKTIDRAYMAGVLDSDGFITIRRQANNPLYPESRSHNEVIGVGQTHPAAVRLLADNFGGNIRLRKRPEENAKQWKPMYYWCITNKKAAACVKSLRPFLRVKARQADLLLALRQSKSTKWGSRRTIKTSPRGRALAPDIIALRERLMGEIRGLNDTRRRM